MTTKTNYCNHKYSFKTEICSNDLLSLMVHIKAINIRCNKWISWKFKGTNFRAAATHFGHQTSWEFAVTNEVSRGRDCPYAFPGNYTCWLVFRACNRSSVRPWKDPAFYGHTYTRFPRSQWDGFQLRRISCLRLYLNICRRGGGCLHRPGGVSINV